MVVVPPRLSTHLYVYIDKKGVDKERKEVVNFWAAAERGSSGMNDPKEKISDTTTAPNMASVTRLVGSGGKALKSTIVTGAKVIDDRKAKTRAALKESIESGSVMVENFVDEGKEAAVLGLEKSIEGIVNEPGKYSGLLKPGDEVFSVQPYFFRKGSDFGEDRKRDGGVCHQCIELFGVRRGKLMAPPNTSQIIEYIVSK